MSKGQTCIGSSKEVGEDRAAAEIRDDETAADLWLEFPEREEGALQWVVLITTVFPVFEVCNEERLN